MNSAKASAHIALDPRRSAWVSANAGSGKTHVLADRVTRLLLAGAQPSRILCLTYTKAAAAEMASRLHTRLGNWALLADAKLTVELEKIGAQEVTPQQLRDARRLFARALETPGGMKIRTIHSFCQHVLARFPLEAGVPTRFTVLDERSTQELLAKARNFVLSRATAGDRELADAVGALAAYASDERFAEILNAMLGQERTKLRDAISAHGGEMKLVVAIRRALNVKPEDTPERLIARFCGSIANSRDRFGEIAAWLCSGSVTDQERGKDLMAFVSGGMGPQAFEKLRCVFLNKDGSRRKNFVTAGTAKINPDHHEYLQQMHERVWKLERDCRAAATAVFTEALLTLANRTFDTYEKLKTARSALDYDDLTRKTRMLLEDRANAQWVLFKLDGGLDHILVDEAQDTSPEQWRIVGKLVEDFFSGTGAREGESVATLFAVGDEKQSIFSFQGADPFAFAKNLREFQERARAARKAFEPVDLLVSYRGANGLLQFIDKVFEFENARKGLSASGAPISHEANRKDVHGRVEFWSAEEPEPNSKDEKVAVDEPEPDAAFKVLARRIADRISRWLAAGVILPSTGEPIQPRDAMILVRRRGPLVEELIRQLIERDIPVAGADRMKLADQIAIADLVALGRFVLLPSDDLNLAALLKSPLIDLSEEDLLTLAHPREGSLWEELKARQDECASFRDACLTLSGAMSRADIVPPFEFYSEVLSRGVRKKLVARLGDEAADAIDEFLALALMHEGAHPPSLESFLHWFGRGASEVKRDMEHGGNAVRVMTVHGAKGLQAPIVIVPDTTQIADQAKKACILYLDGLPFFGVSRKFATEPIEAARAATHEAEMNEYRRLLYVALTRAQDWLIVCGYETKLSPPIQRDSWYEYVQLAASAICHEEKDIAGEMVLAYGDTISSFPKGKTAVSQERISMPQFLVLPAAAEKISRRILQPSQIARTGEPAVLSPLYDDGHRFRRGLFVHTLLASLPSLAPEKRGPAARHFLGAKGVGESERNHIVREVLAVLDSPEFVPLFVPGSRAEVPLSVELPELGPGVRVSGQIDRLAVTADTVFVADYKTNRPPPSRVEEIPELYRTQMALYRAALQKVYPNKRIVCVLIWTDGPKPMQLPDAMLDQETRQITERFVGMPAS